MVTIPKLSSTTQSVNWKDDTCARLTLPLFNPEHPDKIHFTDIVQGEIGSCWFLTVLISYIRPNTKNITERATDLYNSIIEYRKDPTRTIYRITLNDKRIYIDDYVPKSYHKDTLNDKNLKCVWFILFEKAMLSLMTYYADSNKNKYNSPPDIYVDSINIKHGEMKAATIGIGYLVGGNSRYFCLHKKDKTSSLKHTSARDIYVKFKHGHHVMANTSRWTYPGAKFTRKESVTAAGAVPTHCYTIIDIQYSKELNTYLLTIQNPWGRREIAENGAKFNYPEGIVKGKGLSIITWERFHHLFACVHISE